jgi:hypothetical protein
MCHSQHRHSDDLAVDLELDLILTYPDGKPSAKEYCRYPRLGLFYRASQEFVTV